jgi:hypothetical protein
LALCSLAPGLDAQTGTNNSEEAKVSALLGRLSLGQKIDLLGGVDEFYTSALSQIGLPRLQMSEGPLGVRNDGPAANDAPSSSSAVTVVAPPNSSNVVTLDATSVTNSNATLNGTVNPEGSSGYAFFLWGTTPTLWNFNQDVNTAEQAVVANFTTQNFTATLTGLASGTTYY